MTVVAQNAMFCAMIQKRKWILRLAMASAILFFALIVAAFFFPRQFLCVDSGVTKADVIIVLGGASDRPKYAAELFKNRDAPQIIVSGAGDDQINRRILIEDGVPATAIQIEPRSKTTAENAQFAIQLLRKEKMRSAIIVTSWYHSRRALKTFEHNAPSIKFYSRPTYFASTRAEWTRQKISRRIYLEYPKLAGYWICHGVCPF